jgi:hypothetical protein
MVMAGMWTDREKAEISAGGGVRGLGQVDAWAAALCAAGAAALFVRFFDIRHDDAYITFQFARNLASGAGFVFNQGTEPIFGSTTPLFTLMLAAVHAAFGEVLPAAAVALNAAAVGVQGWLLHRLLSRRWPLTAWVACLAALLGGLGQMVFLSLETQVFVALALGTVWALLEERPVACGVLLGLTFLCRYDGALLVPLVGIVFLARSRRLPVLPLGVSLAVVVPWLLYALWSFGSLLPHTFGAKLGITGFSQYLAETLPVLFRVRLLPGGGVVAVLCFAAGLLLAAWRQPLLIVLPAFALAHLLVYASIGPSAAQSWHVAPELFCVRLLVLLGVFGWLEEGARRAATWQPGWARGLRVATAMLALACCAGLGSTLLRESAGVASNFWLGERQARYEAVAAWVKGHVRRDASFMAHEVGTLGYLTRLHMIDPFGLVNETNDWPRTKSPRDFIALLRHYRPDVVLVDTAKQGRLLEQHEGYHVAKVFDWEGHWTTLVVRAPQVLREPRQLASLRDDPRTRRALAAR